MFDTFLTFSSAIHLGKTLLKQNSVNIKLLDFSEVDSEQKFLIEAWNEISGYLFKII